MKTKFTLSWSKPKPKFQAGPFPAHFLASRSTFCQRTVGHACAWEVAAWPSMVRSLLLSPSARRRCAVPALSCDGQGAVGCGEFTLTTDLPTVRCATPPAASLDCVQDDRALVDMSVQDAPRKRPTFAYHRSGPAPWAKAPCPCSTSLAKRPAPGSRCAASPRLRLGHDANDGLRAVLFLPPTQAGPAALAARRHAVGCALQPQASAARRMLAPSAPSFTSRAS